MSNTDYLMTCLTLCRNIHW